MQPEWTGRRNTACAASGSLRGQTVDMALAQPGVAALALAIGQTPRHARRQTQGAAPRQGRGHAARATAQQAVGNGNGNAAAQALLQAHDQAHDQAHGAPQRSEGVLTADATSGQANGRGRAAAHDAPRGRAQGTPVRQPRPQWAGAPMDKAWWQTRRQPRWATTATAQVTARATARGNATGTPDADAPHTPWEHAAAPLAYDTPEDAAEITARTYRDKTVDNT